MAPKNQQLSQNLHAVEVTLSRNASGGVVSLERPTDGVTFGRPTMQLTLTLTIFFTLLAIPPLAEKLINQTVTSRALLGSIALIVAFTGFHWLRTQRQIRRSRRDAILRRRALLHLNDQRGQVDWKEIFYLLVAMTAFGLLLFFYGGIGVCSAAEPVGLVVDDTLGEFSRQLFPSVPMTEGELTQLQKIGLELLVLQGLLGQTPAKMDPPIIELRSKIKRLVGSAMEAVTQGQVEHVSAIVRATRKPGGGVR